MTSINFDFAGGNFQIGGSNNEGNDKSAAQEYPAPTLDPPASGTSAPLGTPPAPFACPEGDNPNAGIPRRSRKDRVKLPPFLPLPDS